MDNASEWRTGERVRLKNGGPTMNLVLWNEEQKAWVCYWFEENELKREFFKCEQLDRID